MYGWENAEAGGSRWDAPQGGVKKERRLDLESWKKTLEEKIFREQRNAHGEEFGGGIERKRKRILWGSSSMEDR